MKREYHFDDTTGIKVVYNGVTYTTLEDIHFEIDDSTPPEHFDPELCAQCSADDPAIMWGEDDDEADWFYPVVWWSCFFSWEELDRWAAKGNWQKHLAGVTLPCGKEE